MKHVLLPHQLDEGGPVELEGRKEGPAGAADQLQEPHITARECGSTALIRRAPTASHGGRRGNAARALCAARSSRRQGPRRGYASRIGGFLPVANEVEHDIEFLLREALAVGRLDPHHKVVEQAGAKHVAEHREGVIVGVLAGFALPL